MDNTSRRANNDGQLDSAAHQIAASAPLRLTLDVEAYRDLWENARDASLLVEPSTGQIIEVNHAAERLYLRSRDELLSLTIPDLRPESSRGQIAFQMHEALDHGVYFETHHVRADGTTLTVAVSSRGVTLKGRTLLHSSVRDITEQVAATERLAESERQLRESAETLALARDAAGIGVWSWNFEDNSIVFDQRMQELYAVPADTADELYFSFWHSRVHPDEVEDVERRLFGAIENRTPFVDEFRIIDPAGGYRDIHSAGIIEYGPDGEPARMVGINQDVTKIREMEKQLRLANRELEHIARIDALTGIPNRVAGLDFLRVEFDRMRKTRTGYGVLMIDVDDFKLINDTFGHLEGDRALVHVTSTMRDSMREADVLVRFGGEEFIAILPGTSLEGARHFAEMLRQAVESTPAENHHLTVSIGVAAATPDDDDEMAAVARADHHMYEAKDAGRNRISY